MPKPSDEELKFQPLEVKVEGNNFEKAFRKFKAMVQADGVLALFKELRYYEKPSDKARRVKMEQIKRHKLNELEAKGMLQPKKRKKKRKSAKNQDSE